MKPKILLVKHFDRAILAALAVLFLFAAYKSFIAADETVKDLTDEIDRHARVVEDEMSDDDKPNLPVPDYRGMLKLRFERPAVISPYSRDPFFPEPDVLVKRVLLTIGQSDESTLEEVHLIELVQSRDEVVKVTHEYDRSKNESVVSITAAGEGDCDVRIRDTLERIYRWRCTVVRVSKPPYPPTQCAFRPMPPVLSEGEQVRPARVLINFVPIATPPPNDKHGITTGADIYRKRSDQLDMDYQLLTPDPLRTATQAEIDDIWERFAGPREEAPAAARRPVGRAAPVPGPGEARVFVPAEAGRAAPPAAGAIARRQPTTSAGAKPLHGYVFLDDDVEPGETYVYKVVTVSEIERGEAVPCEDPVVSEPVLVPSLVSFRVTRISADGARILITVPHPETGQLVTEEFSFVPGMSIRDVKKLKRTIEVRMPDGSIKVHHITDPVEFSTNAVLVDTLTILNKFEYDLDSKLEDNEPVFTFKVKPVSNPLVLYLTRRGALRWKEEVEDLGETQPGRPRTPVRPGGRRPGGLVPGGPGLPGGVPRNPDVR